MFLDFSQNRHLPFVLHNGNVFVDGGDAVSRQLCEIRKQKTAVAQRIVQHLLRDALLNGFGIRFFGLVIHSDSGIEVVVVLNRSIVIKNFQWQIYEIITQNIAH